MCRNIKPLFNYDPPANDEEIRGASLQFVRKVSGMQRPSHANEAAFNDGLGEVSRAVRRLLDALVTDALAKNRESEAAKAAARSRKRFAASTGRSGHVL